MDLYSSLAIIILAALVHASFQLSVSMLTLMSGHSLSAKQSFRKLNDLTASFVLGAGLITMLLVSSTAWTLLRITNGEVSGYVWAIACGILLGTAISVWLFYYRRGKGTTLWIPRDFAEYLTNRTKKTRSTGEAFGLGISSVLGEILFIAAPVIITSLALIQMTPAWQLAGSFIYLLISISPLLTIRILIGGGFSLSKIQRWREKNKYFLQFTAGAGLIILSFFVYASEIIQVSLGGLL